MQSVASPVCMFPFCSIHGDSLRQSIRSEPDEHLRPDQCGRFRRERPGHLSRQKRPWGGPLSTDAASGSPNRKLLFADSSPCDRRGHPLTYLKVRASVLYSFHQCRPGQRSRPRVTIGADTLGP
jgi:hypothetical protein